MAELNPPQWLQAGSHPANTDRLLTKAIVAKEGVVLPGDLSVSERAAGANMSVDVAAGSAFIHGTESGTQGTYHVYNDAVANLTIAAADATNPRIDLVVAQVRDSFYSGGDDDWQLAVLTGTPAASPAEPAVPDNAIVLARVDVDALAAAITDADITDRRSESTLPMGLRAIVTFTSSGTFDKADYPWLRAVRVRLVGGGGGGGGAAATSGSEWAGSGGGSAGGYAEGLVAVDDLATAETVTVGPGGAGGAAGGNAGSAGGASSFGAHVSADGGGGGSHLGPITYSIVTDAVSGGQGTAGDILSRGGSGNVGILLSGPTFGGAGGGGGDSLLGAGARDRAGHGDGLDADAFGGGGGGARNGSSQPARSGGNGADGVVIVELYA